MSKEIKLSEKQLEEGANRESQEWLDACDKAETIILITGFDGKEQVISSYSQTRYSASVPTISGKSE